MECSPYSWSYNQITGGGSDDKLENIRNERSNVAQYCLTCRITTKEYCIRCKQAFCSIDCSFKGYRQHKEDCILSSPHSAMSNPYLNQFNNSKPYYNDCHDSTSSSATSSTNMSIGPEEGCSNVFSKNDELTWPVESKTKNELSNHLSKGLNERFGDCFNWTGISNALASMKISEQPLNPTKNTFLYPMPKYLSRENRIQSEIGKHVEIQIMSVEQNGIVMFVYKNEIESLDRMMRELQNNSTSYRPLRKLTVNHRCLLWYKQEWYRATITHLDPLVVKLVDFGFYTVAQSANLVDIPEEYKNVVPFARAIRVIGLDRKKLVSLQKASEPLKVIPLSQAPSGMWTVKAAEIEDDM